MTMWWDETTIQSTVKRSFVLSQLEDDEKSRIDEAVRFGGGLTESTYLEWIEQRASKLFLILTDLGVPDQIFGVIDDSWGDEDLPIPLEAIDNLRLTPERDDVLERKFWHRQFFYLLRVVDKGNHLEYAEEEIVPLDVVDKRPVVGFVLNSFDKVCLPSRSDEILLRKRIPLGSGPGETPHEEYLSALDQMKVAQHKHVVSLWASYTHRNIGYLLLSPVNEGTLRSFIANLPPSFKNMLKQDRQILLLTWLHCLADALAFVHSRNISHGSLRPSNVGLSTDHHLFLSSSGYFTDREVSRGFDKEAYDFAAPEQWDRPTSSSSRVLTIRAPNSVAALRSGSISTFPSSGCSDTSSIHTTSTSSNNSSGSNPSRPVALAPDVFALGCIFLEILTQLVKRTSKNFTSHRAAKNKLPGRGGGLPDSSYHKNLGQVESWMSMLVKDASKKDDRPFRGIKPIVGLVSRMLNPDPGLRPPALEVRQRLGEILTEDCGIGELCCGVGTPAWEAIEMPSGTALPHSPTETCASTSPMSPFFRRGHSRNSSGSETINTIATANTFEPARSNYAASVATQRTYSQGSISLARTITGDGREIKERRYASGGGRTAKPRPKTPKTKNWQSPMYAIQESSLDPKQGMRPLGEMTIGQAVTTDFDVGSLYELRLHDYDNGGEVRKVGWENF